MAEKANYRDEVVQGFLDIVLQALGAEESNAVGNILLRPTDAFTSEELEEIVACLRNNQPLLLGFNMFITDGSLGYWTTPDGEQQVFGEFANGNIVVYYDEQAEIEHRFTNEVLNTLQNAERNVITSVLQGQTTAFEDVATSVESIIREGKPADACERHILMFIDLLPRDQRDIYTASLFTKDGHPHEKKVALWHRTRPGWEFYGFDDN